MILNIVEREIEKEDERFIVGFVKLYIGEETVWVNTDSFGVFYFFFFF